MRNVNNEVFGWKLAGKITSLVHALLLKKSADIFAVFVPPLGTKQRLSYFDAAQLASKRNCVALHITSRCNSCVTVKSGFFLSSLRKTQVRKNSDRGHNSGQNHPKTQISGYRLLEFFTLKDFLLNRL